MQTFKSIFCSFMLLVFVSDLEGQSFVLDSTFGQFGIARIKSSDPNFESSGWINDHYSFHNNQSIVVIHNHFNPFIGTLMISPGIIRFTADGKKIDSSFAQNGINNTLLTPYNLSIFNSNFAVNLAQLKDKRILLGGRKRQAILPLVYHNAVVCYKADGTMDSSFANNGVLLDIPDPSVFGDSRINDIFEQKETRILLYSEIDAWESNKIMAINQHGKIDSSYGQNGITDFKAFDEVDKRELFFTPEYFTDGSALVPASLYDSSSWVFQYDFMVKIDPIGKIDSSFGSNGKVIIDTNIIANNDFSFNQGSFYKVLKNNQMMGTFQLKLGGHKTLIRFNTDGSIDSSFGNNGLFVFHQALIPSPYDLMSMKGFLELSNGYIVASGYIYDSTSSDPGDVFTILLKPNGTIDSSFGVNGISIVDGGVFAADQTYQIISNDSNSFIACGQSGNLSNLYFLMIKYTRKTNFPAEVKNINEVNTIELYPNPSQNNTSIRTSLPMKKISVMNAMGEVICMHKLDKPRYVIDTSQFPNGIYSVHCILENGQSLSKKLLVNH